MRSTLYAADWVLPVTSPAIRDGAVLVDEGGMIREVGPRGRVAAPADVAVVELGAAILLPGLVNVHSHPELTGMRGMLEDMPFHEWIPALGRSRNGARLGEGDFAAAARWCCLESIAAGVTTIAATEDSGAALDALREAGLRGVVYREVFGPAPPRANPSLRGLVQKVDAMRHAATDLVQVGVSPHAPYTVSDALFRLVAAYAAAENLPIAVHIAESEVEMQLVRDGVGPFAAGLRTRGIDTPPRARSPVALLEATGILGPRTLLIHCVHADEQDVMRIADSGAAIAHCPVANARLGHGTAPVVEFHEAGIAVGIGSDSVASNNRIDLLEEARIAQLMQRARLRSAGALAPERLLRMLTIEGATALGIDARVGALTAGRAADLCAVRLDRPHTHPLHDPVATLIHSARGSDVILTVVNGRPLYRDGEFLSLDPLRLADRIADAAERLRAARDAP